MHFFYRNVFYVLVKFATKTKCPLRSPKVRGDNKATDGLWDPLREKPPAHYRYWTKAGHQRPRSPADCWRLSICCRDLPAEFGSRIITSWKNGGHFLLGGREPTAILPNLGNNKTCARPPAGSLNLLYTTPSPSLVLMRFLNELQGDTPGGPALIVL